MVSEVDELAIRRNVEDREVSLDVEEDWYTPKGNLRTSPVYVTTIANDHLGKSRVISKGDMQELRSVAEEQIRKWNEQEIKDRIRAANQRATEDAEAHCTELVAQAKQSIESIRSILAAGLSGHPALDWQEYFDHAQFPPFSFDKRKPERPNSSPKPELPRRNLVQLLIPSLWKKRVDQHAQDVQSWQKECALQESAWKQQVAAWEKERSAARVQHEQKEVAFCQKQQKKNERIARFRHHFESGAPQTVAPYLKQVLSKSSYPEAFDVAYDISYEEPSKTAVVDLTLPGQDDVTDVVDFKFVKSKRESTPVKMKAADHAELYDTAVKQAVLRTLHEGFASLGDHGAVTGVVVNGWVTYLDKATGHDKTSCIISVSAERDQFHALNLARIDPTECIKSLKGLVAGPMSDIAPVQPILQLDKEDSRFVESQEVLAELNSTTNLAEIGWEEFEHLVRELFGEMFSEGDAEVKVTQTSSDGGVDAIAFDPDPIRGGKFVIQAKRYTKVVPVSAVRDLYGTMISEGATKGILVTTAHFGRDTREFVKDKPISLIDGSNLVYLLEQHGHKVRIDIKAARSKRGRDPLKR